MKDCQGSSTAMQVVRHNAKVLRATVGRYGL